MRWHPTLPILTLCGLLIGCGQDSAVDKADVAFFTPQRSVRLVATARLPGRGHDFSGITYVPLTQHHYIVDDRQGIIEVAIGISRMRYVRTIPWRGLDDVEAIVYIPNPAIEPARYQLAVVEERRARMTLLTLAADARDASYTIVALHQIADPSSWKNNNRGIEAAAYDPVQKVFYFGKEEQPRVIYRATLRHGLFTVTTPWDAEAQLPPTSDIADVFFYDQRLFILDERRDRIYEVNPADGAIRSRFALPPSHRTRYEGLCMRALPNGHIQMIIVAEPNIVMIYDIAERY